MKNLFFIPLLFVCSLCYAQDIIYFVNGDSLQAKVLEINHTSVLYKKYSYLEGPTYSTLKIGITSIQYPNGEKESFKSSVFYRKDLGDSCFKENYFMSSNSLVERMKNTNAEIYKRYREGQETTILGTIILIPGIIALSASGLSIENDPPYQPLKYNRKLLMAGISGIAVGGVLVIIGQARKERAKDAFNRKIIHGNSMQFHIKSQGIGLTYNF